MTATTEDMTFEVTEAERVFDFVNGTFGAFLGAYLGVGLSDESLTSHLAAQIAVFLIVVAFVGLSLRGLCMPVIRGNATLKHSIASIAALSIGAIAFLATCSELGYSIDVMSVIGLGWLLAPLIGVVPLATRRWIKIYE